MGIFSKNRNELDSFDWVHDKKGKISVNSVEVRQQLQLIRLTEEI